jgi:hypothetical protein
MSKRIASGRICVIVKKLAAPGIVSKFCVLGGLVILGLSSTSSVSRSLYEIRLDHAGEGNGLI